MYKGIKRLFSVKHKNKRINQKECFETSDVRHLIFLCWVSIEFNRWHKIYNHMPWLIVHKLYKVDCLQAPSMKTNKCFTDVECHWYYLRCRAKCLCSGKHRKTASGFYTAIIQSKLHCELVISEESVPTNFIIIKRYQWIILMLSITRKIQRV